MLHSRLKRVEEQVAKTLAELLLTETKDERLRAASVTSVHVSKDLRHATVSVSCLDAREGAAEEMLGAIERARGWLRRELGSRVRLKFTPDLRFVLDDSASHAAHIQELLREALPEDEESSEEPPDSDAP
jgi:ribosome-binding factor A